MPCCIGVSLGVDDVEVEGANVKVEAIVVGETDSLCVLAFFAGRVNSSSTDTRGLSGFGLEIFNAVTLLTPDFDLSFRFFFSALFFLGDLSLFFSSTPTVLFSFSMILSKLTSRCSLVGRLRFLDGVLWTSCTGAAPTDQPGTSNMDMLLPKEHRQEKVRLAVRYEEESILRNSIFVSTSAVHSCTWPHAYWPKG